MNKDAKKAHDLIHDLAKYEIGDVVHIAKTIYTSDTGITPVIEAYCVGHRIEIDYQHYVNGDYYDFTYYSRFGRCIGNEGEIFLSAQEAIDNEILKYKNDLEYYQNTSKNTEKMRKEAVEYINRCIKRWQNAANKNVRYIDFIGE